MCPERYFIRSLSALGDPRFWLESSSLTNFDLKMNFTGLSFFQIFISPLLNIVPILDYKISIKTCKGEVPDNIN